MKKMWMLLMALVMALTLVTVQAESAGPIYRLVLRTAEGDVLLGSGVLFRDAAQLITANTCCVEGEMYAIGDDGEHRVLIVTPLEGSDLSLLTLDTPCAAEPLQLTDYMSSAAPELLGVNGEGAYVEARVSNSWKSMYGGYETVLLGSEEGLMPGAVLLDSAGNLVCVVASHHVEGVGMYNALEVAAVPLYAAEGSNSLGFGVATEDGDNAIGGGSSGGRNSIGGITFGGVEYLDFSLSYDAGALNVDWSASAREGGAYCVYFSEMENGYYSTYEVTDGSTSYMTLVPPGNTWCVLVVWAESEAALPQSVDWRGAKVLEVPLQQLTDFSFTNVCYVGCVAAELVDSDEQVLEPLTEVTLAELANPAVVYCLQVRNTYAVTSLVERHMTLEVEAPDGQVYWEMYGYSFDPALQQDDSFYMPISALLEKCAEFSEGGALQPGVYTVRYCIGGELGGETQLIITEGEEEVPEAGAESVSYGPFPTM